MLELKLRLLDGWNEERRRGRALPGRRARGRRRPGAARGRAREHAGLAPLRRAHRRSGALGDFLRERGIATGRHYPSPCTSRRRTRTSGTGRRVPGRGAVAREGLSLPMFPGISEAQLTAVADGIGRSSAVATEPANDAPYRLLDDVRFGDGRRRRRVHQSLRLRDRRRDPDRSVRRDPARGADRRPLQGPEPHLRLRGRDRRGRGVRRARRHVRQRQVPARDDGRRRAADGGGLAAAGDGRRARRLTRVRRDHPGRRPGRGRRDRRSRGRRHARRRARRGRRGLAARPGPSAAAGRAAIGEGRARHRRGTASS